MRSTFRLMDMTIPLEMTTYCLDREFVGHETTYACAIGIGSSLACQAAVYRECGNTLQANSLEYV